MCPGLGKGLRRLTVRAVAVDQLAVGAEPDIDAVMRLGDLRRGNAVVTQGHQQLAPQVGRVVGHDADQALVHQAGAMRPLGIRNGHQRGGIDVVRLDRFAQLARGQGRPRAFGRYLVEHGQPLALQPRPFGVFEDARLAKLLRRQRRAQAAAGGDIARLIGDVGLFGGLRVDQRRGHQRHPQHQGGGDGVSLPRAAHALRFRLLAICLRHRPVPCCFQWDQA